MSGIKRTLEESWYEYASRIELHWMEKEYLNSISKDNESKDNE